MTKVDTDERTIRTQSTLSSIGDMMLETERGPVHAIESPGFMTCEVMREDIETRIAFVIYNPDFQPLGDGVGFGAFAQFDAAAARTLAFSLLRLADRLEPETKQ